MRVLIVEDEKKMAAVLKKGLEADNHRVTLAFDGRSGLDLASTMEFDVVVLDLMLPVIDGFEVARRLRKSDNQTPILMLTARDAVPDIVKGLDLGADDYLTKPFSFEVFLARLRSVARRGSAPRPTLLKVDDLVLNPASHQVTRGEREIHLSPTEFRLLELLMRRSGRVVPRDAIVDAVWDFDHEVEENTLDTFIRLLRSKIDREHDRKLIQTVRGVGYAIRENPRT
ncbi:MAG: DNA-binding response regulator [Acidobacteria bacterium]|nr:MAG: DNA-binding response regulator [Acidobacteriota bacterium]